LQHLLLVLGERAAEGFPHGVVELGARGGQRRDIARSEPVTDFVNDSGPNTNMMSCINRTTSAALPTAGFPWRSRIGITVIETTADRMGKSSWTGGTSTRGFLAPVPSTAIVVATLTDARVGLILCARRCSRPTP
jgi:hypothetical protein